LTPRTGTPTVLWSNFCTGPISLPSDAGASIDEGDRVVKTNHDLNAAGFPGGSGGRSCGESVTQRALGLGQSRRAYWPGAPRALFSVWPRWRLRCAVWWCSAH